VRAGDRVIVIAETDEYFGRSGEIVEINAKGDLVVDVEVPSRWRAAFKPHDIELEEVVRKKKTRRQ